MANATTILQHTLRIGVDEPLYVTTAGAINATGPIGTPPNGTFGLPPQSSIWRGTLWLEAVPVGATGGTGALTVNVEISLDGAVTWQPFATGVALFTAGVGTVQSVNVSGLGGNGTLRLNPTTVTIGTSTGFNVFAHIG